MFKDLSTHDKILATVVAVLLTVAFFVILNAFGMAVLGKF